MCYLDGFVPVSPRARELGNHQVSSLFKGHITTSFHLEQRPVGQLLLSFLSSISERCCSENCFRARITIADFIRSL